MEQVADRCRATPGRQPAGWRQPLLAVAVLAGVVLLALRGAIAEALWPGELIQPVDPDLETLAIFVGTFLGLVVAGIVASRPARGVRPGGGLRRVGSLLAIVVFAVLCATGMTRWAVQEFAFAGLTPTAFPAPFTVVGTGRSGRAHRRWLRLRYGATGRVFSLVVPEAVYVAAQAGDRVTLPVETGRRSIQRMMPDRRLTVADLHRGA